MTDPAAAGSDRKMVTGIFGDPDGGGHHGGVVGCRSDLPLIRAAAARRNAGWPQCFTGAGAVVS